MKLGFLTIVTRTFSRWSDHQGPRLGAALAFYGLLSLAPMVILTVATLSMVFGRRMVQGELLYDATLLLDQRAADTIRSLLQATQPPTHGAMATVFGFATLLFGASAVFSELTDALNTMWNTQPRPTDWLRMCRDKFFSFVLVLAAGLLILVSVIASAFINMLQSMAGKVGAIPVALLETSNILISIAALTLLFALIFRYVPDYPLPWVIVFVGAIVSAILFEIGRAILGWYLAWAGVGSAYGTAGSLVAVMVWAYYSAQIFFLGAEFTCVYAVARGYVLSDPVSTDGSRSPASTSQVHPAT